MEQKIKILEAHPFGMHEQAVNKPFARLDLIIFESENDAEQRYIAKGDEPSHRRQGKQGQVQVVHGKAPALFFDGRFARVGFQFLLFQLPHLLFHDENAQKAPILSINRCL